MSRWIVKLSSNKSISQTIRRIIVRDVYHNRIDHLGEDTLPFELVEKNLEHQRRCLLDSEREKSLPGCDYGHEGEDGEI